MPDTGWRIKISDARCQMSDIRCRMSGTGYPETPVNIRNNRSVKTELGVPVMDRSDPTDRALSGAHKALGAFGRGTGLLRQSLFDDR